MVLGLRESGADRQAGARSQGRGNAFGSRRSSQGNTVRISKTYAGPPHRPTMWRASAISHHGGDLPAHDQCHGDFLASAIPSPSAFASKRQGSHANSQDGSKRKATSLTPAAMLASGLALRPFFEDTIPDSVLLASPQRSLQKPFVQMFPLDWVSEVPLSFAKDLVGNPPFTVHRERDSTRETTVWMERKHR